MHIQDLAAQYDVVIVGGGMVGTTFALNLAQQIDDCNYSILVVEAVDSKNLDQQPSFDSRSTALSFGSRQIFEDMNLWSTIKQVVEPIIEIQISDRGHFGGTTLSNVEQGVEALGYVIENRELGNVLREAMQASAGVNLLVPASITQMKPRQSGMELTVAGSERSTKLSAKLVVLADGGRSSIRETLGIGQSKTDYGQHAIITNVAFERPHSGVAFERFTESGPLAILPLSDFQQSNRGALVWTVSESSREELLRCDEETFRSVLTQRFGERLGRISQIGKRVAYPLSLILAKEQVRPGLVLLGNVAHTLHPVAGQGLNLSLRDSAALVRHLVRAKQQQIAPGEMKILQAYQESQIQDQLESALFTDQTVKLFSNNHLHLLALRKLGLLSLELLPSLRGRFARSAMGLKT
ncbi:MAG TPA: 2-octaprenyl-6-methoxyphenyl hydroxylase [Gammaproteobacteria bacterium]|nr:2-octaprenyl-6-methoxyphenyl hydroxylase [Gammaproteobacteria bacterium]|tara:strand:- start:8520 stop:9749 length:1230 start_codon:yes stop_codon:yes gene_type:complete